MLDRAASIVFDADLTLTNESVFWVAANPTNGSSPYGISVNVGGTLTVAENSWVHPICDMTNGGAVRFVANSVEVQSGGGFDANGYGFRYGDSAASTGDMGWGTQVGDGYGPGFGLRSNRGSGAGHGGIGGWGGLNPAVPGGVVYGNTNAPILPGSGGGCGSGGGGRFAGNGGGVIWIESQTSMTLNGTLKANGANGGVNSGAGSGGGIFINAPSFTGEGDMEVKGGNGGDSGQAGGGGGGRIAVGIGLSSNTVSTLVTGGSVPSLTSFSLHLGFTGSFSVAAGSGTADSADPDRHPFPGHWHYLSDIASLTIVGDPANIGAPYPQGYGTILYPETPITLTNTVASPVDATPGLRWSNLGWSFMTAGEGSPSTGVETQTVFTLSESATLTWLWTNEYELVVQSGSLSSGSVNHDLVNGWYTNHTVVSGISATASNGYVFLQWTGDVPEGSEFDNPLSVPMDQPRSIDAQFTSESGMMKRWNGTGTWETPDRWDPPGMPGPLDEVILESGTTFLASSRSVFSLTIQDDAMLVFTNWATVLTAETVVIESGGVVTLPDAFTDSQMSNRVMIVCSNFTLHADGLIDANHKGFSGSLLEDGYGPGKGLKGPRGSGAGHGAAGGQAEGNGLVAAGVAYGSPDAPTQPGSGGGAFTGSSNPSSVGGPGGGAVRIEASGDVVINGTIQADGGNTTAFGGGGSGGSIYLSGHRFGGTGTLTANGGNGHGNGGGGAGGRIALDYHTLIGTPTIEKKTSPGTGYHNGWLQKRTPPPARPASMGTLYMSDSSLLTTYINGIRSFVVIDDFTDWSPPALTLDSAWVAFDYPLNVNVQGTLNVNNGGLLWLSPGSVLSSGGDTVLQGGTLLLDRSASINVNSHLTMNSGSSLIVAANPTNGSSLYGISVNVGGTLTVAENSWVHPICDMTNGGAVRFVANSVEVQSGGGFDANGYGFRYGFDDGNSGWGTQSGDGYGPGFGLRSNRGSGAGHGGVGGWGGNNPAVPGGVVYGNANAPILPGSGGGGGSSGASRFAGNGGGVIWIESATPMTLNGTLKANGINGGSNSGAGSGGGIFVYAPSFDGNGDMEVKGGNGGDSGLAGDGGGGRISVVTGILIPPDIEKIIQGESLSYIVTLSQAETFSGLANAGSGTANTYEDTDKLPDEGSITWLSSTKTVGTVFIFR